MTSELGSPIEIVRPTRRPVPLILSSPHSGQIYPPCLLQGTRLHLNQLRRLEDAFVDRLFDDAPAKGAPFLRARFARAFVDANREAYEFDPDLLDQPLPPHANGQSAKAKAGLGTIPSRITGKPIYRAPLKLEEVERRLRLAYWPYHRALQALIDESRNRFGRVLLLDCHSMPSFSANGALSQGKGATGLIDIALGDRFTTSCTPLITRAAETYLQRSGLNVTRNRPYAGGHITAHYGQPQIGVHALQIEIRRGLYMDENALRLHDDLDGLKVVLSGLVDALIDLMTQAVASPPAEAQPAE